VALNLDPEVAKFSFSDYPELAPRFRAERDRIVSNFENHRKSETKHASTEPERTTICASPKRIASKEPVYPEGARKDRRETSVRFEIVIGKTGAPGEPFWESDCDLAPFFVAAAEAVRSWRWEPIVCDAEGGPANVLNTIEVKFELR
jgi:hypothetical protein